jgi:hypothetical protein
MANIYTKTMREALQEARDYREPTDVSEGNLSYDEWLKQVKGIEKGAHGINSDEHAKYSKEWKAYANTSESKLTEIVGGKGEMTVTKDGGVMIIKTKDWQTYKAKGWNKKEEVEEGSFWGRDDLVALSKADDKKHGRVTLRKTTNGTVHGITTADKAQIKKYKSQGYKVVEEKLNEDCGCGHGSDCDCPSDCDCGCNAVNNEELTEIHWSNKGEPPAPKGMHKLRSGRDIPSSPKVDKIHKKVAAMTDRNDHFGATIQLAKECGDKDLVQIYKSLELMHRKYGVVGNKSIELRQIFSPVLNNQLDRKFGKYADVLRDAL